MQKDVYRISIRKQGARTKSGQFAARYADPQVIQVDKGDTAQLATALVEAMPKLAPGATSRIDKVQVEFVGVLA